MTHLLDISAICAARPPGVIGARIEYHHETTSTNDEAAHIVREAGDDRAVQSLDGLTILAEYQTRGRGRLGRAWHAPRGASLLATVVLVDEDEPTPHVEPVLLLAVAACDAIARATEVKPHIKWPNDLLVRGRKVGGILIESRTAGGGRRAYLCGIGINCLQQRGHFVDAWREHATSLELVSAMPVDRTRVAVTLLHAIDEWRQAARQGGPQVLREAWLDRCEPLGQRIIVRHDGRTYAGTSVDVDPAAALIVQLDDGGRRAFPTSNTTVIPPEGSGPYES